MWVKTKVPQMEGTSVAEVSHHSGQSQHHDALLKLCGVIGGVGLPLEGRRLMATARKKTFLLRKHDRGDAHARTRHTVGNLSAPSPEMCRNLCSPSAAAVRSRRAELGPWTHGGIFRLLAQMLTDSRFVESAKNTFLCVHVMNDLAGAETDQVPETDVHKYVQYSQLHVACQPDTQ